MMSSPTSRLTKSDYRPLRFVYTELDYVHTSGYKSPWIGEKTFLNSFSTDWLMLKSYKHQTREAAHTHASPHILIYASFNTGKIIHNDIKRQLWATFSMLTHTTFYLMFCFMYIIKKQTFNPHLHSIVGVLLVAVCFSTARCSDVIRGLHKCP